eukprot:TRINITY_DN26797_c0_g1_i1.p2 TRINITY_DN26797_c0_g1~~TRINITY_DN26797_c0_g1_i1.p2  ORF type:complete len:447 (+),score=151.21 TRINITY_DN26797_c0_g1_i1:72-1343(+)
MMRAVARRCGAAAPGCLLPARCRPPPVPALRQPLGAASLLPAAARAPAPAPCWQERLVWRRPLPPGLRQPAACRRPQARFASAPAAPPAPPEPEDEDDLGYIEPDRTYFEILEDWWGIVMDYISPIRWSSWAIEGLYFSCGLPWWLAIVIVGGCLRMCLVPISLFCTRNAARMAQHGEEYQMLKEKKKRIDRSTELDDRERAMQSNSMKMQLDAMQEKGGFKEWYTYLSFVNFVPLLCLYYALRAVIRRHDSTTEGGVLWFTDLTEADPYCILPTVAFAVIVLTAEVQGAQSTDTVRGFTAIIQRWGTRFAGLLGVYMFSATPAATVLAFMSQGLVGFFPAMLLRNQQFRKWYKMPTTTPAPRSNLRDGPKPSLWKRWLKGGAGEDTVQLGGGLGNVAHVPREKLVSAAQFRPARQKKPAAPS